MKSSMVYIALLLLLATGCATTPRQALIAEDRVMTVTAYCPCQKCCGWKRNWYGRPVYASGSMKGERKKVGITASGERARRGTVAADPSVPFGTQMYIPGYGHGVVHDRGGAIRGDHVDVFFKRHKDALAWGRQRLSVRIYHPATQSAQAAR